MIVTDARDKIVRFNQIGLHYNLVADGIYKFRKSLKDPFKSKYLQYIIAGLVSFDMGRMMGPNDASRYDPEKKGFARCLKLKLDKIQPFFSFPINIQLTTLDISKYGKRIKAAYRILSAAGKDCLNQKGYEFHVGATKILHFINPEIFIIVDSNASRAFKYYHRIGYRKSTQPRYSAERYLAALEKAQQDIRRFGIKNFQLLDKDVPVTRIYDKLTFITGSDLATGTREIQIQ